MLKLSVATLNWNGLRHLQSWLPSLRAQTSPADEIIVVDNGSTDGSVEYLSVEHPDVIVVRNETNRGFCEAGNQAIRSASGDVVFLVNNDVLFEPDCLSQLRVAWHSAGDDVLAIFPKALSQQEPSRIDAFGATWTPWKLWTDVGQGQHRDRFTIERRTFGAYFVAPSFRRSAFLDIGGFDETFFAQAEDFDVCYRSNVLGYQLRQYPDAVVYHERHGTKRDNKVDDLLFISRFGVRNLLMVVLKNYELGSLMRFLPWVLATKWARSMVGSIARNGISSTPAAIRVHFGVLGELLRLAPHIHAERRRIQSRRALRDAEIWRL